MEPEQHESKSKPSGIRSAFLCTLDSDNISIESCKADDNGAYSAAAVIKKLYRVQFENNNIADITVCHSENDSVYVNKRGRAKVCQGGGPYGKHL